MVQDLARELSAGVGALSSQLRLRFVDASGHNQGFVALATLRHLYRHGKRTVTSLAASDRVTTQAVSARLKPLEEAGLVLRERDPDDSRRTVVEPTPAGIALVRAAEQGVEDALRHALARLSDAERTVLEQAAPIIAALAADLTGERA